MLITVVAIVAILVLASLLLVEAVAASPHDRGHAVDPGRAVLEGRWPVTETLSAASALGLLVAIALRGPDSVA